jgi:hypothetical protein
MSNNLHLYFRVADQHHFNADPDPVFHLHADPDLAFRFNADPFEPPGRPGLYCERPRLYFEPLQLLNFDFNADPDPSFHFECGSGYSFQKMRILGDPNSQPCFISYVAQDRMVPKKPSRATVPLKQQILLLLQIWEGVPPYSHPGFGFVTYHQSGGYPVSYVDNTTGRLSSLSCTTFSKADHIFFLFAVVRIGF